VSLAPLQLVSAHPWRRATSTTYAFEAVILDALIRSGGKQAAILADVQRRRASLSEQGAQHVGKDYEVEPVAVSSGESAFHPKVSVFSGKDECQLLVGSGNLTFNGWGGNFEILEHLHPWRRA
jgi:phosphatidylserine/phosphatidylglycerophosphate/cardiolipin synthase-like enzyme